MSKQEIRECINAKKKALSAEQIQQYSDTLTQKFITQDFFINSSVLYAYMSYNQEVLTNGIIEHAWKCGKKVAVPKTFDKSYMEFCYINSFEELESGYCNIPEPKTLKIARETEILILMPGLAFDKQFSRIGYGGGFYDKYLAEHSEYKFLKVALGFDFQLYESIETQEHDVRMDVIITPSTVLINTL